MDIPSSQSIQSLQHSRTCEGIDQRQRESSFYNHRSAGDVSYHAATLSYKEIETVSQFDVLTKPPRSFHRLHRKISCFGELVAVYEHKQECPIGNIFKIGRRTPDHHI